MRRPRTDFTGWSQEEIREHHNRLERERRAENPAKDRVRARRYYAQHKTEVAERQRKRISRNPERRREIVRNSRHRHPARVLFEGAQRRADKSGVPFTITREWIENRYKGRCEWTDLEFTTHGRLTGKISPFAPSLDQLVAGEGYTPANTCIVLWALNRFKGDMPLLTMMVIAKALVVKAP